MLLCASHRLAIWGLLPQPHRHHAAADRAAALISCAAIEHDHEAWKAPATTCPVCYYGEEEWPQQAVAAIVSGLNSETHQ